MADQGIGEINKNKDGLQPGFEPIATSTEMPTEQAGTSLDQARTMARNLGEQARSAMADPSATAQELARRAREQAAMATDAVYQQGTRAGEYLSRNVNEYPLAALLIAGAVGYGLAYLIHTQWRNSGPSSNWQD